MKFENFCLKCDYKWESKNIKTSKCPNCNYDGIAKIPVGKGKYDIFLDTEKARWRFTEDDSFDNCLWFTLIEKGFKEIILEIVINSKVKKLRLKSNIISSIFKRTDNKFINQYQFHLTKEIKKYGKSFYLIPDDNEFYVIFKNQQNEAFLVKSILISE